MLFCENNIIFLNLFLPMCLQSFVIFHHKHMVLVKVLLFPHCKEITNILKFQILNFLFSLLLLPQFVYYFQFLNLFHL